MHVEFRDKEYNSLPNPSEQEEKEQVIFMPNDPVVIKSSHLWEESYRKPDVVGVQLSFLCDIHEDLKGLNYEQMLMKIADELLKRKQASRRPTWYDINLTAELKFKQPLVFHDREWSFNEIMQSATTNSTVNGSAKRTYDQYNPVKSDTTSKRSRVTTQNVHVSIVPEFEGDKIEESPPSISAALQCAYYGLERLSAKWTIMHSFVILLTGILVSIHFQGLLILTID